MRESSKRTAKITLVLLGLAGSASMVTAWDDQYLDRSDKISPHTGNSVAANIAIQTVDPWPRNVRNNRININGGRIQLGMKRYQTNTSLKPLSLGTSSVNFNVLQGSSSQSDGGASAGASERK